MHVKSDAELSSGVTTLSGVCWDQNLAMRRALGHFGGSGAVEDSVGGAREPKLGERW